MCPFRHINHCQSIGWSRRGWKQDFRWLETPGEKWQSTLNGGTKMKLESILKVFLGQDRVLNFTVVTLSYGVSAANSKHVYEPSVSGVTVHLVSLYGCVHCLPAFPSHISFPQCSWWWATRHLSGTVHFRSAVFFVILITSSQRGGDGGSEGKKKYSVSYCPIFSLHSIF